MIRNSKFQAARLALVVVGSFIGCLLVEAGYRLYLLQTQPRWFLPLVARDDHPKLWYFQHSPYEYSEEFGYEYVRGVFNGGRIENGAVKECDPAFYEINDLGNTGRIKGTYGDAALRILVFGDSWTGQPNERLTWPDALQDILERQLGHAVHVVNFGRDGYGLLQMFDLAAVKADHWKPDVAVIAFITDDLTRARFWRMKTIIEGRERIMSAVTPTPHPDEHAASDLYFMHSQASHEWCQKARVAPVKDDPIVRTLEALAREAYRRSRLRAHPLTLSQSFVFDRVVHGQPFYRALMAADPSQWPHHRLRDFAEDPRMVASVRALAKTGVPYVLVHLASYWELKAGQEYVRVVDPAQERALLDSLARLAARPVYGTLDHAKLPIQGLEGLSRKFPRDLHPSRRGAEFYAEVVAEVLQRHGYVNPSARPRSPQPSLSSR